MACILGLDFGTKRVGAAVSDPRRLIATPLEVYERRDPTQDARHYQALVREHEVERIVDRPARPPRRSRGDVRLAGPDLGRLARGRSRACRSSITTSVTPPFEAEESLIAAGLKRSKRKGLRDMLAARLLLQNYLDDGCPDSLARPARRSRPR